MKKKTRNRILTIVLLLAVLAVCLAGYGVLRSVNQEAEETETAEEEASLLDLAEDVTLVSLSYEEEGETIRLIWSEEEEAWQRDGMTDFPIDTAAVRTMAEAVTGASVHQVINEDGSNREEYGLDNPAQTVTVGDSTGKSTRIFIGDANNLAEGCYVMLEGSDRVILSDTALATSFDAGWYDLALVDDGPGIGESEVNEITVTQGETTLHFEYDAEGKPDVDVTGEEHLFLRTDDGYQAISSDTESGILGAVEDFSYESLLAYQPEESEREEAGLLSPTAVVTVQYTTTEEVESEDDSEDEENPESEDEEAETVTVTEDHTYTLSVGAYEEDTDTYRVEADGSTSLFAMAAETVSALLDLDPEKMVRLDPTNLDWDTVESFEVTYAGTTHVYTIERDVAVETEETGEDESTASDGTTSGETEETEEGTEEETGEETTTTLYYRDGEEIDAASYTEVTEAIAALAGVRLLEEGEAVNEAAEIILVFHRSVPELDTVTVELIPYNENYDQVAVDGADPSMVVDIGDVQNLIRTLFP